MKKSLLSIVAVLGTVFALPTKIDNNLGTKTFVSQNIANHTLTYKQPKLCDETVVQYSGYLNVGTNEHYFFWFFESRQNPDSAPFTVWLNGGPGCSSMIGLWQELGPCRVNNDGSQAIYNDQGSWNQVSNMLFFDQPSNVGFSYGADNVHSTAEAAPLAYNMIQLFFEAFPKYQKLPFHFFGESYGGHYIPSFADYVLKQNQGLSSSSKSIPINLQSIGVGNGLTDPLIQYQYYEKMACDSSYGSVLSDSDCQKMNASLPQCVKLAQQCYDSGSLDDCANADDFCGTNVEGVYDNSGKSYYDVRTSDSLPSTYIKFLNSASTRSTIGATRSYQECSNSAGAKFGSTVDDIKNFAPNVADLLNNGVRVLLYAGDADYICNWYGNYAWADQLDFNGSKDYQSDSLKGWNVGGKEVGQVQSGGNLTFVRVYEAGHEVPWYQPVAALQMFTDHVNNKPIQ
ncbi:prepro-carboxypeptidase Z [Halteromyces radiatus]|uniref:prepro-carboxypeptidase Z n=1 Tax=Halteromyces radiatus TaxID=101107 RepID=UPI00221EFF3E|nr:prepro-carboxypeptidase Z [Halteromyces radiatus]KAI8083184.1 prepro-carboxypeptidase Z [Halteromyces radiatus]